MRRLKYLLGSLTLVCAALMAQSGSALAIDQFIMNPLLLDGVQEFPSNSSKHTGSGYVCVDTSSNTLRIRFTHSVPPDSETAAHIHGPAARGVNASVKVPLPPGSFKDFTWNYPESDEADILAGLMYANVHSRAFPGGEIRGQIEVDKKPVPSLSEWGLIALALMLVTAGSLFVLRRRQVPA